jgi:predicted alpha/beta-hydrolase family hydrolase
VANDAARFEDLTPDQPPVRGFLHRAKSDDVLVLTHSAGGNCNAPLLVAVAEEFSQRNLNVLRCDLPFRQRRPHGPPLRTASEDQQGLRRAAELMRARFSGRVFMGGHSYGGRMASMLLAADPSVASALSLLSYPLHPPKKPQQMRTQHFPELRTPTLFVQGTKDEFATIDEIDAARKLVTGKSELLVIEGAGHSLTPKFATTIAEAFLRVIG